MFIAMNGQGLAQTILAETSIALRNCRRTVVYPARSLIVGVIIKRQSLFIPETVGIGKDILVNGGIETVEIIKPEPGAPGEKGPPFHQGEDLPLVAVH